MWKPSTERSDMPELQGKVGVITGGGSGIGLACGRLFLEHGAKVGLAGRDVRKLEASSQSLPGQERLSLHKADVSDPAQVRKLVSEVTQKWGGVDILINNAGINIKDRA